MAVLVQTAASVVPSSIAGKSYGIAGEAIAAGQPIYRGPTDGKFYLVDANDSTKIGLIGLATNSAAANQTVGYVADDPTFTHGLAGVAAGDVIVCGATPGALHLVADLAATWYPLIIGVAISATQMVLRITQGTVAKS